MARKRKNQQDLAEIKQAVSAPAPSIQEQTTTGAPLQQQPTVQEYGEEEMQPSILSSEAQPEQQQMPVEQGEQTPLPPQEQAGQPYDPYQQQAQPQQQYYEQYQPYQGSLSSDTITEIAEQVLSEKLASIKTQLEKNIDLKSTLQPKIESIDERLSRIESIIDQLQLSLLQKVGEYVTNVSDLKKELHETQKSFKALSKPGSKKSRNNLP
tara:strand:+ start:2336 stop:2965 length:630 start_codon:yes stop_codon:yes gene_type:complete